jgi:transaldolase / glucose-6-phosphate isomerase
LRSGICWEGSEFKAFSEGAHAGRRNDPETYTSGCGDYDRGVSDANPAIEAQIPAVLRATIEERAGAAGSEHVGTRLREGDSTLWGPEGTPELANRLGWLTIAERMLAQLEEIEGFVAEVLREGFTDVVLLGMGGSSLAPEVLRRSFGHSAEHPTLHVLDSTDAATIASIQQAVDLQRTLFVVSSKSGGTIEPLSLFAHFHSLVPEGASFIAITDPGSGLAKLAEEKGFRHTFLGDPDIGGRYSALSPFGIVPAALMGADVRRLLEGAAAAWDTELRGDESATSGAVWLGAALSALVGEGRDKLTFLISDSLPGLGLWLEQLVAESTGKHGTGILPVAEEPLADPSAYGDDRVFAYLPDLDAPDAAMDERVQALAWAGHPLVTIPTHGPLDLGRVFLLAEIATAVAGWGLKINPFDQPNVQQAKDATNKVLAGYEAEHQLPSVPEADAAALRALALDGKPPSYVAIMAYVQPSSEFDAALAELREAIRAASGCTTTFGYGPRFLHSTGQFHKGGPKEGRFLQLLHDGPLDVEIPGRPFTFTTLKNAQAIGDFETLRELGLPAERVRLQGEDPASAVRSLTASLKEAT